MTAPTRPQVDLARLHRLVDAALEATSRLPHWAPPLDQTQRLMDALRAQAHALAAEVRALLDSEPPVTLDRDLTEWLLNRLEGHARATGETADEATAHRGDADAWLLDALDDHATETATTAHEAAAALEGLTLDCRALAELYECHRPDQSAP
ncbi:hypothetical protein [Streptomyces chilikensis]|uniref:Uncharacterized protein n=1 Tax=Streptomyces chilikensis TaxID=1194079 RepID=A0ABV3EJH7_9ACTN